MRRTLIVVVFWLVMCSSSSFACGLCVELEKNGFSPEVINKAISWYFGTSVKVSGPGKSFQSNDGAIFNIAVSKTGKVFPVTTAKKLRGVVFDGTINTRSAKIFIVDGIDFVGIKADKAIPRKEQMAALTKTPAIITGENKTFRYSDEIIEVPADIEGR